MHTQTLGLDIAQATPACCLYDGTRKLHRTFPNTPSGFRHLFAWLRRLALPTVPVFLEATGGYEEAVATALDAQGWPVYRLNPYRVRRWAESELLRLKTDPLDAYAIAAYARTAENLHRWQPLPPAYRALQQLVRVREALQETRQAYQNRLGAPGVLPATAALYQACCDDCTQRLAEVDR